MNCPVYVKKIRVPVYGSSLWIIVSRSIPAAIDHVEDLINSPICKKEGRSSIRAYAYAYEAETGAERYLLFLRPSSKPGEIAHEVKHLVNIIFAWRGVRLSLSNDEHECHFLEVLIDSVYRAIAAFTKKHPRKKPKPLQISEPLPTFAS